MSVTQDIQQVVVDARYTQLRDQRLAAALTEEDRAEQDGLDPLERLTCRTTGAGCTTASRPHNTCSW